MATEGKEMNLWEVVDLAKDCPTYCYEKTRRVVEDVGVRVWGFAWRFEEIAKERRDLELKQCEDACLTMKKQCPAVEDIRLAVEQASAARAVGAEGAKVASDEAADRQNDLRQVSVSSDGKFIVDKTKSNMLARGLLGDFVKPKGEDDVLWPEREYVNAEDEEGCGASRARVPSQLQLRRCENAAEQFTRTLFSIATKPTKVFFEKPEDAKSKSEFLARVPGEESESKNRAELHPSEKIKGTGAQVEESWAKSRAGHGGMPMPKIDTGLPPPGARPAPDGKGGTAIDLDRLPSSGGTSSGTAPFGKMQPSTTTAQNDPMEKRDKLKVDEQKLLEMKAWSRSASEGIALEEKHAALRREAEQQAKQ